MAVRFVRPPALDRTLARVHRRGHPDPPRERSSTPTPTSRTLAHPGSDRLPCHDRQQCRWRGLARAPRHVGAWAWRRPAWQRGRAYAKAGRRSGVTVSQPSAAGPERSPMSAPDCRRRMCATRSSPSLRSVIRRQDPGPRTVRRTRGPRGSNTSPGMGAVIELTDEDRNIVKHRSARPSRRQGRPIWPIMRTSGGPACRSRREPSSSETPVRPGPHSAASRPPST